MGCNSCGREPRIEPCFPGAGLVKNCPEKLVLFKKVVVPASLGDDTTFPPALGKYKNVLLYYEANNAVYLYSSDGIPTKLTTDIGDVSELIQKEAATRENADKQLSERIDNLDTKVDKIPVVVSDIDPDLEYASAIVTLKYTQTDVQAGTSEERQVSFNTATHEQAGVMSAQDKAKLDDIEQMTKEQFNNIWENS